MISMAQLGINLNLSGTKRQLLDFQSSISKTVIAVNALLATIGVGVFNVFEKGIEVHIQTERAEAGMAGLISSLYKVRDATGKLVEGPEKFVKSLEIAQQQVRKLRIAAITSSLSTEELQESMMQGLGYANNAGMSVDQARQFAVKMAGIGKVMLPRAGMLPQEIKSLLSGKIDNNSTIGNAMGFGAGGANEKAYKQAKETGKLFDYLMPKLAEFDKAIQLQAKGIGGTIDQLKDLYSIFSMDSSFALVDQLKKVQDITDKIFNKDTAQWDKAFHPLIVTFDTIGGLIGTEIFNGISNVVQLAKDFGVYIKEDQSLITGLEAAWEVVKLIMSSIWGVAKEIGTQFIGLARWVIEGINPGLEGSNGELSDMQVAMKALVGFASLIAIKFALIKDVVRGVVDSIRLVTGGAVIIDQKVRGMANNAGATVAGWFGADNKKKQFQQAAQDNIAKGQAGQDIAFKDNKTMQNVDQYGLSAVMFDTLTAIEKSITINDNIGKSKTNTNFTKSWDELTKRLATKDGNSTTEGAGNGGKNGKAKVEKARAMANALYALEKSRLEGEIALNKEANRQEEEDLNDKFKNNLVSAEEYYAAKRKLSNKDYEDQMRLLEQEKKASEQRATDNPTNAIQNKVEAMKIEQQILLLKAKQINAVADLDREEKNYLNTKRKQASLDDIENSKLDAENKLAIDKINQDQLISLKRLTATQSLQIDKQRLEEQYVIEALALNDRMALANDDLEQQRQITQEKLALERKYAQDKAQIDSEIVLDSQKDAMDIQQSFEDNFASLIENIATGKKSFLDAIKDFANAIASEFAKLAAKKLAAGLFDGGGATGGGGGFLSGVSSFFAKGISGGGWSLPSFAVGTDYVPHDMVAQIHKGEKIVPAKYNNDKNMGGGVVVNNNYIMNQVPDQRTQAQMGMMAATSINNAMRRNG